MNPVDAYIDALPPEKAVIAEQLRRMIHALVPGVQEKLSFKLPFYHYYGMFCYINAIKTGGVDLCILNGKRIAPDFAQLEVKGRAIVASIRLFHVKDIDRLQVAEILAAAAIDKEVMAAEKKRKRR